MRSFLHLTYEFFVNFMLSTRQRAKPHIAWYFPLLKGDMMSEVSTLTIKIPLELKEKIKAAALEKQFSLSSEVCERLEQSFNPAAKNAKAGRKDGKTHHSEIDNQGIEEISEQPLSQKELKKLRQLLKDGVKPAQKKK
ncbi:Arc-like DNA binding domain-containing protein [Yersinia entomophaga]